MIFFVIYAFAVWFLAWRLRRRWGAAAVLACSLVPIVLGEMAMDAWLSRVAAGSTVSMHLALWAYAALILSVGGLVAWAPRKLEAWRCAHCAYDLRGNTLGYCPECAAQAPARLVSAAAQSEASPASQRRDDRSAA